MNNRTRTTDAFGSLNKLKVKSLKCLKREVESNDASTAIEASFVILRLLKMYEQQV